MAQPVHQQFRIRHAFSSDFNKLIEFYRSNSSPALPLESAKTIGDAIEAGRTLIVEPRHNPGVVLATGSLFQLTPQASVTYIAELAGARVTEALDGAGPVTVRMMLIGLRLLGHAAYEQPFAAGATNSIIAVVHKDNNARIATLEAMNMHPLGDTLPSWLNCNQIAWYGSTIDDDWRYYYANNDTIVRSLEVLDAIGLFSSSITLHRQNKLSGQQESFEFALDLNDLIDAAEDLKTILHRTASAVLMPPPPSILFA